jgi:hypothetical protein
MLNKWDMYLIVFMRLEGAIVASGLKQVIRASPTRSNIFSPYNLI